ncbi:hydrolase [Afipia sp. Root123D2]|uniref:cell wall hydrolase n=1 Tax=Afipia sp. Root123D2 TaxID=1736436 RepID=UPI000701FFC8|nr:cell wall hydrolase [Afipia sp. Root123D2]KQW20769.1 hydrolase [Afipia sp. Root123D2]
MTMLRNGPKGARFAPFGFVLCLLTVTPTEIGYQDLAALLAHQPGVTERWQQYVFASARRSIQVASFNFVRPIGTDVPRTASYRLASLGGAGGVMSSFDRNPLGQPVRPLQASDFPSVVRTLKGDRLPVHVPEPEQPEAAAPTDETLPANDNGSVKGAKTAEAAPLDEELQAALSSPRLPQYDAATDAKATAGGALDETALAALHATPNPAVEPIAETPRDPFSVKTSSLFFGSSSLGVSSESLERWQPGQEPIIVVPGADPDMKQSATVPVAPAPAESAGGETVAGKGEVTGQMQTPAERLKLNEKSRAKAEKCLSEAVYFEARGEAVRGQIAVAQVVLNRAFSGYYPTTVCGVVYQNSHRHLACQFTFACDGIRDVVKEPDMWERAKKIAKASLDGRLWLPEVGKSTHYHAYWVHPSWVHEMKKMYRFGVHTFYRPRAWGDGSDAPKWGTPAQTAEISRELASEKP